MRRRRVGGAVVAALVGALVVLLGVAPAAPVAAHAHLLSSEPASNEVLAAPPRRVVLRFDESVEAATSVVRLHDGRGHLIAEVAGRRADDTRSDTVVFPLDQVDQLGDGAYAVAWRVASADGHVVDGAFAFQVGSATSSTSEVLATVRAGLGGSSRLATLGWLSRWVALLAAIVLLGGGWWAVRAAPPAADDPRVRRLLLTSAVAAALATTIGVAVYGAQLRGGDLGDIADLQTWRRVAASRTATVMVARAAVAALWVALAVRWTHRRGRPWRVTAALSAPAGLVLVPVVGHGATQAPRPLWFAVDLVHLAATAMWLGGLLLFTFGGPQWFDDAQRATLQRFSRAALVAVALIVTTGIAQTLRITGGLGDLSVSAWGRLLLAKIVLAVVVVAMGGVSRAVLHRVGTRSIRRTVAVEAVIAVAVVGLAAGVVGAAPHREVHARPVVSSVRAGAVAAVVGVRPGLVGANELSVDLRVDDGQPIDAVEVRVKPADSSLPFAPVPMTSIGRDRAAGTWLAIQPGPWTVEVIVRRGASTSRLATTVVVAG